MDACIHALANLLTQEFPGSWRFQPNFNPSNIIIVAGSGSDSNYVICIWPPITGWRVTDPDRGRLRIIRRRRWRGSNNRNATYITTQFNQGIPDPAMAIAILALDPPPSLVSIAPIYWG